MWGKFRPIDWAFWEKLGYGFLNPIIGLGSYLQGDIASGIVLSAGFIAGYSLIIAEFAAGYDYWDNGAGYLGTIGLFIAVPNLVLGFAMPFVNGSTRYAQAFDGIRLCLAPASGGMDISVMYSVRF